MKNDLKLIDCIPADIEASEALLLFLDDKLLNKRKLNISKEEAFTIENSQSFSKIFSTEPRESLITTNLRIKKTEATKHLSFSKQGSLPGINNVEKGSAFITEPLDFSKESQAMSKILIKSNILNSKFRLYDNKLVDSLQNSIQKRNYNSISVLPKLKESISIQNKYAITALEQQIKAFRQQNDQLNSKKY
jgi:hypothetical protein